MWYIRAKSGRAASYIIVQSIKAKVCMDGWIHDFCYFFTQKSIIENMIYNCTTLWNKCIELNKKYCHESRKKIFSGLRCKNRNEYMNVMYVGNVFLK